MSKHLPVARVSTQAVLPHKRVEMGSLHADIFGRLRDVRVAALKRLGQEAALKFLNDRILRLLLKLLEILPAMGKIRDGRPC